MIDTIRQFAEQKLGHPIADADWSPEARDTWKKLRHHCVLGSVQRHGRRHGWTIPLTVIQNKIVDEILREPLAVLDIESVPSAMVLFGAWTRGVILPQALWDSFASGFPVTPQLTKTQVCENISRPRDGKSPVFVFDRDGKTAEK